MRDPALSKDDLPTFHIWMQLIKNVAIAKRDLLKLRLYIEAESKFFTKISYGSSANGSGLGSRRSALSKGGLYMEMDATLSATSNTNRKTADAFEFHKKMVVEVPAAPSRQDRRTSQLYPAGKGL